MEIGAKIKELRKKHDVTQEQLAERLCVSFQAVSKWENEIALPDITLVPAIASFFRVTTDYLFDYTVPPEPPKLEPKLELKIIKIAKYEDVNEIINLLQGNKTVIMNHENVDKEIVDQMKDKIISDVADVTINQIAPTTIVLTRSPFSI